MVGTRQHQQPVGELREPAHLVQDHVDVADRLPISGGLSDQLRVSARHGDRRAELV